MMDLGNLEMVVVSTASLLLFVLLVLIIELFLGFYKKCNRRIMMKIYVFNLANTRAEGLNELVFIIIC